MSRTTACCHSRLASGPTRPLALRSTCTQPPKQCVAAVPLHRATVGRPPGLDCSLISQCQICSLNSIAPLSYLPCECQRGSSCGFPHSLCLGHLAWLLPPGRGRRRLSRYQREAYSCTFSQEFFLNKSFYSGVGRY